MTEAVSSPWYTNNATFDYTTLQTCITYKLKHRVLPMPMVVTLLYSIGTMLIFIIRSYNTLQKCISYKHKHSL